MAMALIRSSEWCRAWPTNKQLAFGVKKGKGNGQFIQEFIGLLRYWIYIYICFRLYVGQEIQSFIGLWDINSVWNYLNIGLIILNTIVWWWSCSIRNRSWKHGRWMNYDNSWCWNQRFIIYCWSNSCNWNHEFLNCWLAITRSWNHG